jgi:hypothetical protein
MGIIILSMVSLGFAVLLASIAEKKGLNTVFWAVMGAVLGPFALPFILIKKKDKK